MPIWRGRCWKRERPPIPKAAPCLPRWPSVLACQHAAITACCAWRALSPIWVAQHRSPCHMSPLLPPLGLDHLPDTFGRVGAVKPLQLLNPRGRGDVDFCEIIADHIDPDENLAFLFQNRTNGRANLKIARGQANLLRSPARVHVRPRLPRLRHTVDRPDGFAIHQ